VKIAAHSFVSPGDAPAIITQYVAWMERQFRACQTTRSIYPSIRNDFPVIRTASAKNCCFHVLQPTFLFPLETPLRLSCNMLCKKLLFSRTAAHIFVSSRDAPAIIMQYVVWIKRQFNACQTPRSTYLSIFSSFRVIRCLSQCISPKIAIFTTFLFPLGTPLGQSR